MTQRLTVIGGAFGSGKTEFAITYALKQKEEKGGPVGLIDLDIVNPYFRTRDQAAPLAEQGVTVISTKPGMEYSDLPALSPRIFGILQDKSNQAVFDLGGDPVGARALGRFHQYFMNEPYHFLVVLNPFRPNTRNGGEVQSLLSGLEENSRLRATGLVSNINLGRETTIAVWEEGLKKVESISESLGLSVVYHAIEEQFLAAHGTFFAGVPGIYPIKLQMLPPWSRE